MGTDVYMEWDGMRPSEKKARYTGFSIDAGNVGYLRASIWMDNENAVLRELMPDHWEYTEKEADSGGKPYDFEVKYAQLQRLARMYLLAVMLGKEVEHREHAKAKEMSKALKKMLEEKGFGENVKGGEPMDLSSAVMWLNSLFQFFHLGMEKQKKGLNPRVFISW
nr:hypothetical protein 7 [bacterium]